MSNSWAFEVRLTRQPEADTHGPIRVDAEVRQLADSCNGVQRFGLDPPALHCALYVRGKDARTKKEVFVAAPEHFQTHLKNSDPMRIDELASFSFQKLHFDSRRSGLTTASLRKSSFTQVTAPTYCLP